MSNVARAVVVLFMLLPLARIGHAKSHHRRAHAHAPAPAAQVDLFAGYSSPTAAVYNATEGAPGASVSYLGSSTLTTQGALMFRDPLYPLYLRPTSLDWTGLALAMLAVYTPKLVPTIDHAPVLPIPMMSHGAYGLSLWGRIR